MSNENIKTIYTFTVSTEKAAEGEKPAETIVTYFAFKKPSRVEREDAEAYKIAKFGEFIKKGVLPLAILSKTYANFDGILDESQKADFLKLRHEYVEKQREYVLAKVNDDKEKVKVLIDTMLLLRDQIVRLEQQQSSFFDNTAEARARNKLTEYLILHMAHVRNKPEDPWTPYFKGSDAKGFEPLEKYAAMDELEESGNEVFKKAFATLALVATFYVMTGGNLKAEEVEMFLSDSKRDPLLDDVPELSDFPQNESKPTS